MSASIILRETCCRISYLKSSSDISHLESSSRFQQLTTVSKIPSTDIIHSSIPSILPKLTSSSSILQSATTSSMPQSVASSGFHQLTTSSDASQFTSYSTAHISAASLSLATLSTFSNLSSLRLSSGRLQAMIPSSVQSRTSSGVTQITPSDSFESTMFALLNRSPTSKPALASWISSRFAVSSIGDTIPVTKEITLSPSRSEMSSMTVQTVPDSSPSAASSHEPLSSSMSSISSKLATSQTLKSINFLRSSFDSSTMPTSSIIITMSSVIPMWCPCTCEQAKLIAGLTNTNKTTEEVEEELEEALVELTVDSKTTTVNERKLVSVDDKRASAKVVGTIGVIFCSLIFILIVLSDLPVLIRTIKGLF